MDSSSLIGLAQIKQFELLKELFLKVYIPEAVYEEVVVKEKEEVGSEETARDMAGLMDVNVMGVIGIIDLAVEKGLDINKRSLVDLLIEMGFRISDSLYRRMFPNAK